MSLSAFQKVPALDRRGGGYGFNENFFIDEVDFEYCVRFVQAGFKNKCCTEVHLNHSIGNPKRWTILPQWNIHSDFRLYYIIRNMTYMIHTYSEYAKKYRYKKNLRMKIISRFLASGTPARIFAAVRLVKKAKNDAKTLREIK